VECSSDDHLLCHCRNETPHSETYSFGEGRFRPNQEILTNELLPVTSVIILIVLQSAKSPTAILPRRLETACLTSVTVTSDKVSECMHEIIILALLANETQIGEWPKMC
jgi:hypothetical protein